MRAFTLTIQMEDGTSHSVTSNMRDQVRFEEQGRKRKWGNQFESIGLWEVFLAWSAMERRGLTSLGFDAFIDTVQQIDSQAVAVNPTHAAQPTA